MTAGYMCYVVPFYGKIDIRVVLCVDEVCRIGLCEPARLPITTDFRPHKSVLNKHFEHFPHTISLIPGENVYGDDTVCILNSILFVL